MPTDNAQTALDGVTAIDFRKNFALATGAGRGMASILRDVAALWFAAGKLTSNEYFYYRLWEQGYDATAQRAFIGKIAQNQMHLACNDLDWHPAVADKLRFYGIMAEAGLPCPSCWRSYIPAGLCHPCPP